MQIEVRIEPDCTEPFVVVHTARVTDEIDALLKRLQPETPKLLIGFADGCAEVLRPEMLTRVYAEGGRVLAETKGRAYTLRGPLYEWETRLLPEGFVRISQSELISLHHVKTFDLSFAGTICVRLTDGTETYASRRYVSKLKTILGL